MRVLLTGATGFVGRALKLHLAVAGHDVVPITRGPYDISGCVKWDLGAGEPPPPGLPDRVDAVVHAAQSRNHRDLLADSSEMFAVNTASTAALLGYAIRAGASRFCLLSTGTVYEPFDRGLDEDTPLEPRSMLGASKLAAEILVRPYATLIKTSVLRLFTPYGPGQTGRLIPNLVERVRGGQAVQLSADGTGLRLAPIHVDDVCAIVAAAIEGAWIGTLNVASPRATTLREMTEMIGREVGRAPRFEVGTGAALDLAPPVSRLGALIDLDAFVSLTDGLASVSLADNVPPLARLEQIDTAWRSSAE